MLVFWRSRWVSVSALVGAGWFLVLRIYYWLKPLLPVPLRLMVRRWWAKRKRAACGGQWPILESAKVAPNGWPGWPEGKEFAFLLTHDVETPWGRDHVRDLAEAEMALGFRSSFNFIPEGPYQVPPELRRWLVEHGFEVGVHDHRHDGWLYKSRPHFLASAVCINHFLKHWGAVGFRSGFMFHNLEWIKSLNVLYDSSTFDTDPFEPQPDGVKTIFPFWVTGHNGGGYVELPYTLVQDSTLFVILQERSNEIWKRKLQWIAKHGGMALLNVHPDYIAFDDRRQTRDKFPLTHYTEFLGWVKQTYEGRYLHKLPKDVAEYCHRCLKTSRVLLNLGFALVVFAQNGMADLLTAA
jgi:hypothetical protein